MDEYTKPDYNNVALITIDVQNDFSLPGTPLEIKGTIDAVPQIVLLLNLFRRLCRPVVHIVRLYKKDGSNADMVRKKKIIEGAEILIPASDGSQLVTALKPNDHKLDTKLLLRGGIQELTANEFVIYKSRWGAFYRTSLEKLLKKKRINTLVFTGCNFPNCPRTSIYEASERDFRLVIVRDAISGIYEKGLEELSNIGCEIATASEIENSLKAA